MNFARFSVTRPVAVTMRIAALVLLGAICATRLPIDLLPRVSFPTVAVVTQWPNVIHANVHDGCVVEATVRGTVMEERPLRTYAHRALLP